MDILDLASDLKEFTEKLLGPSLEELGLIMGEKIRLLRLKSSIKIFKRAKELLKEAGISEPKPVDLKTLIPLLEYCSLENEDSDLIEKWAGLLASASSVGLKTYAYPHILCQLSTTEVKILDLLFEDFEEGRKEVDIKWISRKLISNKFNLYELDVIVYLNNLFRLGLCRSNTIAIAIDGTASEDDIVYGEYTLTQLGADFVKTCRGPNQSSVG